MAKLPRAERFEQLIDFPTRHQFKIIGRRGGGISEAVQQKLRELGFDNVIPVERASSKGRYVSVTVEVQVSSGQILDQIYIELEALPDLLYLF